MNTKLRHDVALIHSRFCSGLADINRMLIVYRLAESPANVSEIVDAVDLPQSNVSRHLKILRECGIVTGERDGRTIVYALSDDRIVNALEVLRSIIADQLRAQADLVETVADGALDF